MSIIYDNKNSTNQKFSAYQEEMEDFDFFKSLYPAELMEMQMCIEEKCDELEYPLSMMYDKYPDKVRLEKIVKDMCETHISYDAKLMQVMTISEMLRRRIRRRV